MAVVESHTCKSYDTVKYVLSNTPHCTKLTDKRVLNIVLNNIDGLRDDDGNLLRNQNPNYIINQFRSSLDKSRAGRHKRHKLQSIIISFSREEFDTADLSIQASQAQKLVQLYVKEFFSDSQSLSVVQADSDSAHLHVHLLVGSVETDGTTVSTNRFTVTKLRKQFDELLATDFEKVTGHEWPGAANKLKRKDKKSLFTRSKWENQLKQVIGQTVKSVDSVTKFKEKLKEHGITVKERKKGTAWTYSQQVQTKDGSKQYRVRDYYERRDKNGAIKSRRGLGAQFTKKKIEEYIKEKEVSTNAHKDNKTARCRRSKKAVEKGYETLPQQVADQQRIRANTRIGEYSGEKYSREIQRRRLQRRGQQQRKAVPTEKESQNRRSPAASSRQQYRPSRNVKKNVNEKRRAKRRKTRQINDDGPEF